MVVAYDTLPVVTDALKALEHDAPSIWDECLGNVPLDAELGDSAATHAAFLDAAHVVNARFSITALSIARWSRGRRSAAGIRQRDG